MNNFTRQTVVSLLMLTIFYVTAGVYSKYVKSQDSTGVLPAIINRHNYGYTAPVTIDTL